MHSDTPRAFTLVPRISHPNVVPPRGRRRDCCVHGVCKAGKRGFETAKQSELDYLFLNHAHTFVEHRRGREYVPQAALIHACVPSCVKDFLCNRAALNVRRRGRGRDNDIF